MNEKLKELITRHEGYRTRIYKDTRNIPTVGVGHNVVANPLPENMAEYLHDNGEITPAMVEELLENDVAHAIDGCKKLYPVFLTFSENRQNALCDFVFQVGLGTAKTFKHTNTCINTGDWDGAADNLMDSEYAKQVPKRAQEICDLIRKG